MIAGSNAQKAGSFSSLVPKLHLGTHLSAKFNFAKSGISKCNLETRPKKSSFLKPPPIGRQISCKITMN